ncbi:hypothetical protein GW17_00053378 [Ensete ventricosum]|nr:hypothetical protein GW17_00053378 [Ensete ventricosum]
MGDMEGVKTNPAAMAADAGREEGEEHDVADLVGELLEIIDSVGSFAAYRRTQRKESFNLVRRMKLVAPLLEELQDLEYPIPDAAYARLCGLLKAFSVARKLLRCCHDGSKIYLVCALDGAILERLAKKLELQTLPDLRAETMAIKKLIKERCGANADSTQQIMDLLNKFKRVAGIEDANGLSDVTLPKYLEKCPSLMIPNDFLCPVSLEIMSDPVIVATGQVLQVAPIVLVSSLCDKWCEKNKVELLKRDADQDSDHLEQKEEIPSLVRGLSSIHLDVQRKAVQKIRMLSKENPDNRILIAKHGGIPALVSLLPYPDSKIQEHTVTALLNLSIDEGNKRIIANEGAIPAIIEILKSGTVEAKENSATALFSLSMLEENKVMIGNMNGIPPLVDLLQDGNIRGKKDAATALFNLVLNYGNRARAIDAGIVPPLLNVLGDKNLGMVDEALSIFLLLASHPDGHTAIGQLPFIETLVQLIKEGTPKNKECALSVLLELGTHDSSLVSAAQRLGVYEHVCEVEKSGTNRAKRKAKSLLPLINKCKEV